MKILVIQTRPGIGDLCVFLPPIHEIATHNQKFQIDLLTKKRTFAKDTLAYDPYIKNIFYLEDYNNSNFKLLKFIKTNHYDKAYIFHYGVRYPIICKISGVKKTFSYGILKKNENIVEKSRSSCSEWLNKKDLEFPYKIYRSNTTQSSDNIIIGIGGSGPTKKWPTQNFIELINKIKLLKKCNFLLAGGEQEQEVATKLIMALPDVTIISLCNKKISEAINLIEGAKLYIGNDTGFMHLCAGLGILSYGLFGDTPANYADYAKKITPIIPVGIDIVGHGSLAMNKISADHVFEQIKQSI
jgi:heptosyltransferase-2